MARPLATCSSVSACGTRTTVTSSLFRAAIRAAVGLLIAPLWIIGLAYVLWDRRRRALHDLVFGTVVPYTSPPRTGLREIRRRQVW